MNTVGYLFKDERNPAAPYVLFMEGLTEDDGSPSERTIEVRFDTLLDAILRIAGIHDNIGGGFTMELGEPEHFERVRNQEEE